MQIDPYILAFSAVTVFATIFMGFWSARKSKTASDFFVAGRSVSVGWNASAISGEYLSAASFMGVAGMVMSSGYDALWYPVCYACGYLFLLLFIAGPLRRFGAYTIPDFAEGRFDSPVFRKIAVCFVLFIGFFYTMPQMKGAGTTLAYIFPGLPYWAGVVLVGAVITLNVALGGMKGITLVQAFQYWAKMFAISVPIFVLMAVYGHYGKQLGVNGQPQSKLSQVRKILLQPDDFSSLLVKQTWTESYGGVKDEISIKARRLGFGSVWRPLPRPTCALNMALAGYSNYRFDLRSGGALYFDKSFGDFGRFSHFELDTTLTPALTNAVSTRSYRLYIEQLLAANGVSVVRCVSGAPALILTTNLAKFGLSPGESASVADPDDELLAESTDSSFVRKPLPDKVRTDSTWLSPFAQSEATTTNWIAISTGMSLPAVNGWVHLEPPDRLSRLAERVESLFGRGQSYYMVSDIKMISVVLQYAQLSGQTVIAHTDVGLTRMLGPYTLNRANWNGTVAQTEAFLEKNGVSLVKERGAVLVITPAMAAARLLAQQTSARKPLPAKGPADSTWLNPFGPLTTKAANAAAGKSEPDWSKRSQLSDPLPFVQRKPNLLRDLDQFTEKFGSQSPSGNYQWTTNEPLWAILTRLKSAAGVVDILCETNLLLQTVMIKQPQALPATESVSFIEATLKEQGVSIIRASKQEWWAVSASQAASYIRPLDTKPYALLYTYSLIIALVCGTAGLPHILVRFYTNPDGVAAKRTTMWVMILIGVFYVFPPVFGVMGRNLFPELYSGIGAKGTDKIVLELPRLLNAQYAPLGSILSGITCAGAFAAFMSTFSGLLVSMTGAMAHDVYGRMFRPKSTPDQRMKMFKVFAVVLGGVAVLLGSFVEPLEINFMVGQAFAIAAASYFPLLFMAVWWRKLTMKGAATGMLTGGLSAVVAISLTSFSTLAIAPGKAGELFAVFKPLNDFWAAHPLLRILCEQPALWAVPLAIGLMIVVSKLTAKEVPADIRMKMLVLHAPEKLGLKQEYIQEHQHGH